MKYYTIEQIANHFKVSIKSARNKLSNNGIKKHKSVNGRALYLFNDLHKIKKDNTRFCLKREMFNFSKDGQFLIIKSKMNYE
jgi:Fe2+ transport system protein FeoA